MPDGRRVEGSGEQPEGDVENNMTWPPSEENDMSWPAPPVPEDQMTLPPPVEMEMSWPPPPEGTMMLARIEVPHI